MVKKIPTGMDVDYKVELAKILTYQAVPQSEVQIVVSKVVLVYDIEEIIDLEKELKTLVHKK